MKKAFHCFLTAIGLLLSVGCVMVKQEKIPDGWPSLVRNPAPPQFAGMYRATPAATTGSAASRTSIENSLPYFLTGKGSSNAASYRIEEISGRLVLKTRTGPVEIPIAGQKSRSRKGGLFIRGETKRILDPLWNGVTKDDLYLFAAADGSLIGLREGSGAALTVGVLPTVATRRNWILWKRAE